MPQPDGPMSAVTSRLAAVDGDVLHGAERRRSSSDTSRSSMTVSPGAVAGRAIRARARSRSWMARDRRGRGSAVDRCVERGSGLGGVHGRLLYHWMCLDRRARTMRASRFRMKMRTRITMIAAAAMPWKSSCGRWAQLKTWIGRTVKPPWSGCGSDGHERGRADDDERRRLADRPGHGQDDAGHDPGRGGREDRAADHLPLARSERVGALALGLGHGLERLEAGDDHERQDDQGEGRRAREQDRPEAEQPDEDGQPEDAVDDRRHAGQVADVRLRAAGSGGCRARTRRGRRPPRCRSGR